MELEIGMICLLEMFLNNLYNKLGKLLNQLISKLLNLNKNHQKVLQELILVVIGLSLISMDKLLNLQLKKYL
jgi:hypothetical protein